MLMLRCSVYKYYKPSRNVSLFVTPCFKSCDKKLFLPLKIFQRKNDYIITNSKLRFEVVVHEIPFKNIIIYNNATILHFIKRRKMLSLA